MFNNKMGNYIRKFNIALLRLYELYKNRRYGVFFGVRDCQYYILFTQKSGENINKYTTVH